MLERVTQQERYRSDESVQTSLFQPELQSRFRFATALINRSGTGDRTQGFQPPPPPMSTNGRAQSANFIWPEWALTARIAGAYFHPSESSTIIEERLDALAAQQVSVILADSPWGEEWAAWVDDEEFNRIQTLITEVVQKAHTRGMKVVLYQVGLELIAEPDRNPGLEHPEWAQRSLADEPILFNDVTNEEQHWLHDGMWVMWLSPCAPTIDGDAEGDEEGDDASGSTFRDLAFARVAAMAATGIDGLWVDQVYLQSSVGSHHELWPSRDPCSAAAFTAATSHEVPTEENWDDPAFQQWVVWRHEQIAEFLRAEKAVVRAINPDIVFFNENSSVDTGRATYVGNDPTHYVNDLDMSTGHEIETIADRMDEGETGMQLATLDEWLAFRTMVAFARGADRGKPSWVLTYGYAQRDSAQLAGLVLAEGANFYETKGPQMADTVGEEFRTRLFTWLADYSGAFYSGESMAEVAVLFSPRTRDLLDTVSGEPYDVQDSVHFAAYRAVTNRLYQAHIPFDIVVDTDTAAFTRYQVLILPEVQIVTDSILSALQAFPGTVVRIGETGLYDEWFHNRETTEQMGTVEHQLPGLTEDNRTVVLDEVVTIANTALFSTDAAASLQFGVRRSTTGYEIVAVNLATTPTITTTITLTVRDQEQISSVRFSPLESTATCQQSTLLFQVHSGEVPLNSGDRRVGKNVTERFNDKLLHIVMPAGIETVAIISITSEPRLTPTVPPTLTVTTVPSPSITPVITATSSTPEHVTLHQQWLPIVSGP